MNREVEERMVAMYFDNRDFEKNAKQTIETLDELKKSMNLEDSVKGFDVFDRMKRSSGMDQMQKSADKLKNTFSSIGSVINKTFSFATGPLKSLENSFSTIQGYVNKYLGFDLASKIVNSVESAVRSLTIQPISQGWSQYENEVESVRTIMSSTGRSIQDVEKNLEDLTVYADKTVYSLQDMTSNIGKFTNNGVPLEKATRAMMGIANAAADAGQGTQQASMAMYNFSQAIGVGKMTSIDWKSIENANMATQRLKDTFIEIASLQGQLKKVGEGKDAKYYYTKDSKGKELKDKSKWTEVNYQNFRDTLSKGWLTSDAMTAALEIYSGQNLSIQALEAMGIKDKETQDRFLKIGQEALQAAQQVRTFSKLMDSLKDAAASGWASTFKLLFGNAEEATSLWTSLSDSIGGMLSRSSEHRNQILRDWKNTREILGTEIVDSGSANGGLVEKVIYGRNGREILIDGLKNLGSVLGGIGKAFKMAFGDVFGTLTGSDLFSKTQSFEQTTKRIKEYFGDLNDEGSRLNKIYRVIRGVVSAFSMWKKSIRSLVDTVVKFFVPSFGGVLDLMAYVGDFLYDLNKADPSEILGKIADKLKGVWDKMKSFFSGIGSSIGSFASGALSSARDLPIIGWLTDLATSVAGAAGQLLGSINLSGAWDWLNGLWESAKSTWATLSSGAKEAFSDLGEFLSQPYDWLMVHLGLRNAETGEDVDVLEGLSFDDVGIVKWIEDAFEAISAIFGEDSIPAYFTEVKDIIVEFFTAPWDFINEYILGDGKDLFARFESPDGSEPGFISWLRSVWDGIVGFWNNTIIEGAKTAFKWATEFFSEPWNWIKNALSLTIDFFTAPNDGHEGKTGFVAWISDVWEKAKSFWNETIVGGATTAFKWVTEFFSVPWEWLKHALNITIDFFAAPNDGHEGKTGFVAWISDVWEKAKSFWNETIVGGASSAFKWVTEFFSVPWEWLKKALSLTIDFFTKPDDGHEGKTGFVSWLTFVWDNIKDFWNNTIVGGAKTALEWASEFFAEPWEWLKHALGATVSFFKDPDPATGDTSFVKWLKTVWGNIETVWTEYFVEDKLGIFSAIGKFLSDTWAWIIELFHSVTGSGGSAEEASEEAAKASEPTEAVSETAEAIEENTDESLTVFDRIIAAIGGFLDKAKDFLGGIIDFDTATKLFNGLGTFLKGAFSALGDLLSIVGKWLRGDKGSITESEWQSMYAVIDLLCVSLVPSLVTLITTLVGGLIGKKFGISMISIGSEIRDLGIGIAAIVASIIGLKTFGVTSEQIAEYGTWIMGIGVVLAGIIAVVGWVKGQFAKEGDDDDDDSSPWADFGNTFLKAVEKIAIIWVIMDKLPDVLNAAAEAKAKCPNASYADDLIKTVMTIVGAALSVVAAVEIFGLLNEKAGISIGATQKAVLVVVEAIGIMLGAMWLIDEMFSEETTQSIAEKTKNIGEAIGNLVGGLVSAIGEGVGDAIYYLRNGESRKQTSEREMKEFNNQVDQFIKIANVLDPSSMEQLSGVIEKFTEFGEKFTWEGQEYSALFSLESFRGFSKGFSTLLSSLLELLAYSLPGVNATEGVELTKASENLKAFGDPQFISLLESIFNLIPAVMVPIAAIEFDPSQFDNFAAWAEAWQKMIDEGGFSTIYRIMSQLFKELYNALKYGTESMAETGSFADFSLDKLISNYTKFSEAFELFNVIIDFYNKMMNIQQDKKFTPYYSGSHDKRSRFVQNFDTMLDELEKLYDMLQKHTKLDNLHELPAVTGITTILSAFNLMSEGIGSAEWEKRFVTFKDFIGNEKAVDEYITAVEAIYDRLKQSKLGTDEGITFDGLQIVKSLFDAIQEGFNQTTNIPVIKAQPLIDAIVLSISGGKDDLVEAIRQFVQAGIDASVDKNLEGLDSNGINILNKASDLISMLNSVSLNGEGSLLGDFSMEDFMGKLGLDKITSMLDDPAVDNKINELTEKLQSKLDFSDAVKLDIVDPETQEKTDIITYINNKVTDIQTALDEVGAIRITITPTFNLDALKPVNLQEQLNKYTYRIPASISMPEMNINYDGLKNALDIDEIKLKLDTIASKMEQWGSTNNASTVNLGAHMDGIRNAVNGMRFYIDGNTLVGYILPMIDRGLGQRSVLFQRTGSAGAWSAEYN